MPEENSMFKCKCGKLIRADRIICPYCKQKVEHKGEVSIIKREEQANQKGESPAIKKEEQTSQKEEKPVVNKEQAINREIFPFSFQGNGGTLFGIQIVNLLLIIVTLGIYYFWAKARVRVYMWSQIDCNGDRLAYHGTGIEVLKGWIKAALVFGIPFYAFQNLPAIIGAPMPFIIIGVILSFIIISIFIPVATVGSRRYRLSRSSLRGIRFSFRGKWQEFAKIFFAGSALIMLTLGFYTPYFDMRRQTFLMEKAYYGSEKFGFNGQGKDLFGSFVLAVILAIPTIFISMFWYQYKRTIYFWNHATFGKARFQSSITFGSFFGLYIVNALILICTLGFGLPWVKVRIMRYYLRNLVLEGEIDLSTVVQEAQEATAFGEEVGDFLSLDFDIG
jgi:uncharacterized membrane protein YjgN (DUF898 family)